MNAGTRCCWILAAAGMGLLLESAVAEAVKDREGAVRQDKEKMEQDQRWIYNDVEKGFAEAKRTGKPLLVVLRCVPCLSCAGIDAQVLLQDSDLNPVLDQFVCVRVINANALDLAKFQFDCDLSFSTLFFNGDGTVYARYGSWKHQKDPQDKTTAGYRRTLETVLELHRGYPANKKALAGKQGGPTPFKTPVEIPSLAAKYTRELDWSGKVVQSCVHCHMIGDAHRAWYRAKKQPVPSEWIFPMPGPETIGVTLAADSAATVESVAANSAAARAGLKAGDRIAAFGGQPIASQADFSWVLHRTPDGGAALPVNVQRGDGKPALLQVALAEDWRLAADSGKRVSAWSMRGMATGGLLLEDLTDAERQQRGLPLDKMALRAKHVGQYGNHAAAKNAGFRVDDVIVELAGQSARLSEGALFAYLLQNHFIGETVNAVVRRGEQRLEIKLPMQ